MEQNVLKQSHVSRKEENVILESEVYNNNTSKQVLEEKLLNVELECELKQNTKIPLHVIQSSISHWDSSFLTEETCQIISDYCSYKLNQVVKSAIEFMKISGRSKLTIEDFNRGLYINHEEIPLESKLSCIEGLKRESSDIPIYNTSVYSMKFSGSSSHTKGDFNQILYNNDEELESNVSPCNKGTKRKRKTLKCKSEKNNLISNNVLISRKWLNCNPFSKDIKNLSPELQKYFNVVTMVLLSKNEKMCLKVIHNFKTNNCILSLFPYFVNFFSFNLNRLNHDFLRTSIFLKALHSLLSNYKLYFSQKVLLSEVADTILQFLVCDIPISNCMGDCWLLKDTAAYLLVKILNRSESNELFLKIVYSLKSIFCDFHKSLDSHYGAIVALNSIGVPAILLAISPCVNDYIEYINNVYQSDTEKRHCVKRIQGQLIQSYYLLIHHYFKYESFDSYTFKVEDHLHFPFYYLEFLKNNKVFPFLSQSRFVDIYGDRLVQCFPLANLYHLM